MTPNTSYQWSCLAQMHSFGGISQADSVGGQVQGLQLESQLAAAGGRLKQQAQRLVQTGPGSQDTLQAVTGVQAHGRGASAMDKFTQQSLHLKGGAHVPSIGARQTANPGAKPAHLLILIQLSLRFEGW